MARKPKARAKGRSDRERSSRKCACVLALQPTFGLPGGKGSKDARWCARCPDKPANAVNARTGKPSRGSTQQRQARPAARDKAAIAPAPAPMPVGGKRRRGAQAPPGPAVRVKIEEPLPAAVPAASAADDDDTAADEAAGDVCPADPAALLGRQVCRLFLPRPDAHRERWYFGRVTAVRRAGRRGGGGAALWEVTYDEDADVEDLEWGELAPVLLPLGERVIKREE